MLLSLVHGAGREDVAAGRPASEVFADLLEQLRASGPTVLDVHDPERRSAAVQATMAASLSRLTDQEQDRYEELAVFGEDVDVPLQVIERYWAHAGAFTPARTRQLCRRLSDLSLVLSYRLDPPRLRLHDVIRAYLRSITRCPMMALGWSLVDAQRVLAPLGPK